VGLLAAAKGLWMVSAVKIDSKQAGEEARNDTEDTAAAIKVTANAAQSAARISNTGIISSIAFPAIFQISITFTMPFGCDAWFLTSVLCIAQLLAPLASRSLTHELTVRRFPPVLVAFADWVGAIVSFDFGQVGSPECALPGDAETALLAKFLLTVCITQPSLERRNSVLFC
jgi:hypothetical protein